MSVTSFAAAVMMAYAGGVAELPVLAYESAQLPIKVSEEQTRFRDAQGRTTGTATPAGSGGYTFRDAQGKTIGRSSTDTSGSTRFWDSSGRSLGTSSGPAPARPMFPGPR
jgi:hypothetical protein